VIARDAALRRDGERARARAAVRRCSSASTSTSAALRRTKMGKSFFGFELE
jgi:hypothetical protein